MPRRRIVDFSKVIMPHKIDINVKQNAADYTRISDLLTASWIKGSLHGLRKEVCG
jgi:hypothetical protein